jgi:hypothetical protein
VLRRSQRLTCSGSVGDSCRPGQQIEDPHLGEVVASSHELSPGCAKRPAIEVEVAFIAADERERAFSERCVCSEVIVGQGTSGRRCRKWGRARGVSDEGPSSSSRDRSRECLRTRRRVAPMAARAPAFLSRPARRREQWPAARVRSPDGARGWPRSRSPRCERLPGSPASGQTHRTRMRHRRPRTAMTRGFRSQPGGDPGSRSRLGG